MKYFTAIAAVTLVLSSFNTHAVSWGDLKKSVLGDKEKKEVKVEPVALDSGYPVAKAFRNIDPLMAHYGSSILKLMTGYQHFLTAYGEKELATKANALIEDLENGAALDSDMVERISNTNDELGTKVNSLQKESEQLNKSSKKKFVKGLPYFVDGTDQYRFVVERGKKYVESMEDEAKNASNLSWKQKAERLLTGGIKVKTVLTVTKGAKNDWPLLYKSFLSIYKFCQSNDIPLPENADSVLKDIEL